MRLVARVFALLLAAALVAPATAQQVAPVLAISTPFALRGGSLTFTVTGTPGAMVQLLQSTQPAEVDLGATGIQFYKSGTEVSIASGRIAANGKLSKTITIAAQAKLGTVNYVQARSQASGQSRLGNGVVYRIDSALPAGTREPTAIAATPDGRRAYVGHNEGGIVTVLDAVSDSKLAELPITVETGGVPHKPIHIAVDPEGRHAFVANAAATTLSVIHTASGSIAGQIAVPRGNRGIGFDFRSTRRIYVANETANAVLVFEEAPLGTFTARTPIPLQGRAPGPLLVLPDGKLAVGVRTGAEVEIIDPAAAPGTTTLTRTAIAGLPFGLAWNGGEILIPTFVPSDTQGLEGFNRVLRLDGTTFQLQGSLFEDVGTDYRSIVALPALAGAASFFAVNGAGNGSTLIADGASLQLLDNVDLAPGNPTATPQDLAVVRDPSTGRPAKLYVTDYFRETVRPIRIDTGPPFTLKPEIALAWSGKVRVPLSGDLSAADDGEWFFRSVNLLGGSALSPNRVTCDSCHPDGSADNLRGRLKQVPAAWGMVDTNPYTWQGGARTLSATTVAAINTHNHTGNPMPAGADQLLLEYFGAHQPPASIYRNPDGSLTADQLAGKAIFEGAGQCSSCHAAPLFIPPAGSPRTIVAGIGTGLAPINVPSLRGAWATAPYLHDGAATTLMDVLTINPLDAHGQRAAGLTVTQRQQLVEYLKAL